MQLRQRNEPSKADATPGAPAPGRHAAPLAGEPPAKTLRAVLEGAFVALAATGASLACSVAVLPLLDARPTYMPLFIGVLAAAWMARLPAGLATTALSALIFDYLFIAPADSFRIETRDDAVRVGLFCLTSICISLVCEAMHVARDRAREQGAAVRSARRRSVIREAQFRTALETGRVVAWDWNAETGDIVRSDTARALLGIEDENAHGFLRLVHEEDRPFVRESIRLALEQGQPYDVEFRVLNPDGGVRWLADRAQRRTDPDTGHRHLTGAAVDITGRKRVERALRESEARFRTLAESIPQLAWAAHPDGTIHWFNQRWYEYTGTTPDQMQRLGWTSYHDPELLPKVLERWQAAVASGDAVDMTFPLRGADGRYRPFLTKVTPLKNERGEVLQWFGTNTDVSEQRALEDRLREEDRRKDEFLATLAHELRNPLAPLRNGLEVLRLADNDSAALLRTRAMMDRQLGQMARLLDDLLDLSRVTRGRLELRKRRVAIADILDSAVETSRPLIESAGHALVVDNAAEPVEVEADPLRLAQVFSNLLNNAAKYTERGGRLHVAVRREGFEVAVVVRDNGVGILPAMLPRIFEMFSQGSPTLERSQGGLGIGLSLVRYLVELHGGTVTASSEGAGRGSEFVVRLPIAVSVPAVAPANSDAPGATPDAAPGGLRILIADDNRDAAESLALLLRLVGHEVRAVGDGLAAVQAAEEFQPDVALLDIGMPRLNGYETCREMRRQPCGSNVLIVAVTGWGQDDDRRRSEEAGFNAHLVKPVEAEALLRIVAAARPAGQTVAA